LGLEEGEGVKESIRDSAILIGLGPDCEVGVGASAGRFGRVDGSEGLRIPVVAQGMILLAYCFFVSSCVDDDSGLGKYFTVKDLYYTVLYCEYTIIIRGYPLTILVWLLDRCYQKRILPRGPTLKLKKKGGIFSAVIFVRPPLRSYEFVK
jgi:hypothetical protein